MLALAASGAMTLAACRATTLPRVPEPSTGPAAPGTDTRDLGPEALLRFVRAREDRVSTLRARFTLRLRNGGQVQEYVILHTCKVSMHDILQFQIVETSPESIVNAVSASAAAVV